MVPQQTAANEIVTLGDVKELAASSGPCITMVVQIPTPRELPARLKNASRAIEGKLADRNIERAAAASLLAPIRELAQEIETAGIWSNTLIIFRSPDLFRYFLLYAREPEVEAVEERFQIRPLLAALAREQRFHFLCLSRNHIRLLRCTQHRVEETGLRGLVPTNMSAWLHTRRPDHVLDNRSAAGPSVGSMKGVSFGTSSDREREDEYLAHFFKAVDEGVHKILRDAPAPLLLGGVEEEVALYRRLTANSRVFEGAVRGSPDGVADVQLHQRGLEVVMREPSEGLRHSLAHFEKHRDDLHVTAGAAALVKAAREGRVSDLFLSTGAAFQGAWNSETMEVDAANPAEDLYNAAALQTVLHGGQAFVLAPEEMPVRREAIAVLRF
jgi:hypothetical protein